MLCHAAHKIFVRLQGSNRGHGSESAGQALPSGLPGTLRAVLGLQRNWAIVQRVPVHFFTPTPRLPITGICSSVVQALQLAHHYWYTTRVHTLCFVQSLGFDKCMMTCVHFNHIAQNISLPENSSMLCLFIPPSPWLQATTGLPTVSVVLPFSECHLIGIIQSVAFSDWLLSLSNKHLWLLHAFSWCDSSFLFFPLNNILFCGCTTIYSLLKDILVALMSWQLTFIHSSRISWLLSCLGNYK